MQFNEIESYNLSEDLKVTLSSYTHTQTGHLEHLFNVRVVKPSENGPIYTKEGVTFTASQCKKLMEALDSLPIYWNCMGQADYFTDSGNLVTIEKGSLAVFCTTQDTITICRLQKERSGKVLTLKISEWVELIKVLPRWYKNCVAY
jgi:hypothetical protein